MSSPVLVPAPDAIPVPWGWLQALLLVTFVLHLLFMNIMVGSAVISFAEKVTGALKGREEIHRDTSIRLPYIIAFAVNLGVPPLLFFSVLWGNVGYVATTLMAVWWLSVIAILIAAYYGAYIWRYRFDRLGSAATVLVGLVSLLLLFVGFVFVNNFSMLLRPESWEAYFDNPSGTLLNLGDPTLWPRYLHFVAASLAVGGLFRAVVWSRRKRRGDEGATRGIESGMRWFFWATLVQIAVGLWYLLVQPGRVLDLFLGGSAIHTALIGAGILLAVSMLVTAFRGKVAATAIHLVLTIAVMAGVRETVRFASLKDHFTPDTLAVDAQYSPMVLFLAAFAVGIAVVVYMLRLVWRVAAKGGER